MHPDRLPPLTDIQRWRVQMFKREYKHYGKVSVVRKGMAPGHIRISVTLGGEVRSFQYDEYGRLFAKWTQPRLLLPEIPPLYDALRATNPYMDNED